MIELEVPSKTFLVGEYAVLQGAPALVAATKPFFHFSAIKSEHEQSCPFHSESPAGRWYRQSEVLLRHQKIESSDPHGARGGFGASGAQFVFLHTLCTYLQSQKIEDDVVDVWNDFKVCAHEGSGADVAAQTLGGITYFQSGTFDARSYSWPFDEIDFFIVPTGQKIATHSHLQSLGALELKELIAADHRAIDGFFANNIEAFVAGLQDFRRELIKLNFQADSTLPLLDQINALPGVLGSKGCGAMGADTIFAIVDREFRDEFREGLHKMKRESIASNLHLAPRTQLRVT